MKILFMTIENHPGTLGGIQTFGRNLKEIYGKDLVFLTNKFNVKKTHNVEDVIEVFSSNKILRAINKICKNIFRKYLIIKKIKKINPDICILSSYNELEFFKNINVKVILVQHTAAERYLFNKENKDFFEIINMKSPDYIVCLSEKDKELFEKNIRSKDIKYKLIRFPNTIDILNKKKIRNKNLVVISRIALGSKRLDLAIKAMKKLPEFTLNIYGEGPAESFYKEIVEKEKIINVNFKGGTNRVQDKLDEASIYIITSDFEGYPISAIEAMRRGLPIIIRNTFNAASDIVVNNENGILLDKEWKEEKFIVAIKKIYDNYDYYSENSKKLGKRYSSEIVKKEWDKILGYKG